MNTFIHPRDMAEEIHRIAERQVAAMSEDAVRRLAEINSVPPGFNGGLTAFLVLAARDWLNRLEQGK